MDGAGPRGVLPREPARLLRAAAMPVAALHAACGRGVECGGPADSDIAGPADSDMAGPQSPLQRLSHVRHLP